MSRWPSVVRNATLGRRRVMMALRPAVLATLNTRASPTPTSAAPRNTDTSLAMTSVGTLDTETSPPSIATTSVNVPPTSTATSLVAVIERRQRVAPNQGDATAGG